MDACDVYSYQSHVLIQQRAALGADHCRAQVPALGVAQVAARPLLAVWADQAAWAEVQALQFSVGAIRLDDRHRQDWQTLWDLPPSDRDTLEPS